MGGNSSKKKIKKENLEGFLFYEQYGNCPQLMQVPRTVEELRLRWVCHEAGTDIRRKYSKSKVLNDVVMARERYYEAIRHTYFISQGKGIGKDNPGVNYLFKTDLSVHNLLSDLLKLAKICYNLDRIEESVMICERYIEIYEKFPKYQYRGDSFEKIYLHLVLCMFEKNDFENAKIFIQKAKRKLVEDFGENLNKDNIIDQIIEPFEYFLENEVWRKDRTKPKIIQQKKKIMIQQQKQQKQEEEEGDEYEIDDKATVFLRVKFDIHLPPVDPYRMRKYKNEIREKDDLLVERLSYISESLVMLSSMNNEKKKKEIIRIDITGTNFNDPFLVWKIFLLN